jgi:hypothetical protein
LLRALGTLPRACLRLAYALQSPVLGVLRVAQHPRDSRAAEVHQVLLLIGDVLHLEDVELQPQLVEVVLCVVDECFGELEAVLVHLLGRELTQDLPQDPFERLARHHHDGLRLHPQKALDRLMIVARVGRDLHVRDCMDREWNSPLREGVHDANLDAVQPHIHARYGLEDRPTPPATAVGDHLEPDARTVGQAPLAPREDEHLVRRSDVQEARDGKHEKEKEEDDTDGDAQVHGELRRIERPYPCGLHFRCQHGREHSPGAGPNVEEGPPPHAGRGQLVTRT